MWRAEAELSARLSGEHAFEACKAARDADAAPPGANNQTTMSFERKAT